MERDKKINKAMDLLLEHDYVSWYQEAVNIISDYIDYLETKITENRVPKDYPKVDEDLKLAIAGWWCAADDDWCGDGDAFDWIEETGILDRNNLTREDIMKSIPKEWIT